MTEPLPLFQVNPDLNLASLAEAYACDGRVQVPNVLTEASAQVLHDVLARHTLWGLAWQAGRDGPHAVRSSELTADARAAMGRKVGSAMATRDYAFVYAQYPLLKAYQEGWAPGGPHDLLLEHVNDEPFLDLARAVTGRSDLCKADGQATLFGPGHFLAEHDDTGEEIDGRQVAYVLSMCAVDWRPDWGGYLLFLDANNDVEAGYRPCFNTLNLFTVPRRHTVSAVASYAPVERFALTGWLRDR